MFKKKKPNQMDMGDLLDRLAAVKPLERYCAESMVTKDTGRNPFASLQYGEILTKLMSAAVRCSRDASNLFRLWAQVDRQLRHGISRPVTFLFGFRDKAVDGTNPIAYAAGVCNGIAMQEYKQIWRLDVYPKDDYHIATAAMDLTRVAYVPDGTKGKGE